MTARRAALVLLCLLGAGIWVARERARSARLAHEINMLYGRQSDLKRQLWEQQMEEARLQSPAMLRERLSELAGGDGPATRGEQRVRRTGLGRGRGARHRSPP